MRVVLLLLMLVAFAGGCGGGDDEAGGTTSTTTTTTDSPDECASVDAPAAREQEMREPPTDTLSEGTTYSLVFETSCGSFTVALDQELAPNTAASLVALARDGFFDDTVFHRVFPGFVIQGGDPTQTGGGGPGYSTVDEPPSDVAYTKGVVAMAKTEVEPAGTSGSQFFVVTAPDAGLPPDYAVVGEVTEGMDTVERIEALGQGDGPPTQPVVVSSVTVTES